MLARFRAWADAAPGFLDEDAREAWNLFTTLSRRRGYGMGSAQPIALIDILAAFHLRRVHDPEDRDRLLHLIERLDDAWLGHQQQKKKAKSDDASPPAREKSARGRRRGAS